MPLSPKAILMAKEAPPLCMASALQKAFGKGWLLWEPSVLWSEVKDDFGIDLPRPARDAILAFRLCLLTNTPWQDWHPFLSVALAMNGIPHNPEYAMPAQPSHLAYAIDVMRRMKPDQEFEPEVRNMAGVILWDNGICWAPEYPMGSLVNDYLLSHQRSDDQQTLLSFIAKDYLEDDGNDAMDDYDTVRLHTIKLRALDLYVNMKRSLEKELA